MARRRLSAKEEALLAAELEAEAASDDDSAWDYENPKRLAPAQSAVLSARVSVEQFQAVSRLAAERGVSVSNLVKEAIGLLAASRAPNVYFSGSVRQVTMVDRNVLAGSRSSAGDFEFSLEPGESTSTTDGVLVA
jgi:hypothetical protein